MSRHAPIVALLFSFTACAHIQPRPPSAATREPAATSASAPASAVTFRQDATGSIASWTPVRGAPTALVTIVEFGDFQCPFCRRAHVTIAALREAYGDKLRLAFRNLPLPFHEHAAPAAEAAMAAAAQGKFWAMYDLLYGADQSLEEANLRLAAQAAGLDLAAYDQAMADHRYRKQIDDDRAHAAALGITGTPTFIVNGRLLPGAQPIETFRAAIDAELKTAQAMLAAGTPRAHLYDARIAVDEPAPEPARRAAAPPEPLKPRRAYLSAWTPQRGAKTAAVTLVEFGDFECPFTGRVAATLAQLRTHYGDELRIAFRNEPLDFHPSARAYSELAMAAQEQGRFWAVYDYIFAHQDELRALGGAPDARAEHVARAVGLDLARYQRSLAQHAHAREIDADLAEARRLGARGTPTFFINGQPLLGAQPVDRFVDVIDAELKKARARLAGGVRREELYEKTLTSIAEPPAP